MTRDRFHILAVSIVLSAAVATPLGAVTLSPFEAAVAARFAACYEAEGWALTAEDRALVDETAPDLAELLAASVEDLGGCAAPDAPTSCATWVDACSCEQLGGELGEVISDDFAAGPIPDWARSYAEAVTAKVAECHAVELAGTGAEPTTEDREALDAYGQFLGSALGTLTSEGMCTANETVMPACTSSIAATDCAEVLERVAAVAADVEAAAEQTPEEVEAILAEDAPEMTDAELDATIDELAAQSTGPIPMFAGACAEILDCGLGEALED